MTYKIKLEFYDDVPSYMVVNTIQKSDWVMNKLERIVEETESELGDEPPTWGKFDGITNKILADLNGAFDDIIDFTINIDDMTVLEGE